MSRRRSSSRLPFVKKESVGVDLPDLLILDRFSENDVEAWTERSKDLDEVHDAVYYGPEAERRRRHSELMEALNKAVPISCAVSRWVRMIEARYVDDPLSCAGSLKGGGRFNIGMDADKRLRPPFPALYIAEDADTAYHEFYQCAKGTKVGGLSPEDLSLGRSNAQFFLNGQVSNVFDATDLDSLEAICRVFARISMPASVPPILRRLGSPKAIQMINNAATLRQQINRNWRTWPSQFGIPSPSQQLAELVVMAGFDAIRYRSTKGDGYCLAVFPTNIGNAGTYIELADPHSSSVKHSGMSVDTADELAGWEVVRPGERPINNK